MRKGKWYRISAKADEAEISIFGDIGGWWGETDVASFKTDWDAIKNKKSITVLVNSPGGDVFDGIAIYNIIASEREKVDVEVIGLAASAASIVALAGATLAMDDGSHFMIHNASGVVWGTGDDMRDMADTLDKISASLIDIYEANSDLSRKEIQAAMDAETWYSADEAVEAGFATATVDNGEIAARFDLARYKYAHVPSEMLENAEPETFPDSIRDFETFLRDAGASRTDAKRIAAHGFTQRDVEEPEGDSTEPEQSYISEGKYRELDIEIMEMQNYE